MDIIGARQTIDTLSMLAEKTKGNLTADGRGFSAEQPLRSAHGLRGSHQRAVASATVGQPRGPGGDGTANQTRGTMKATLTVLGSGTSMGVPTLGCDCAVCHSDDPHDRRTRPSVMIEYGGQGRADRHHARFYAQAIREKITQRRCRALHPHSRRPHSRHRRPASVQLPAQAGEVAAVCASGCGGISAQDVPLHF